MLNKLKTDLRKLANQEKAKFLSKYFKTGKGEYGEGDIFLGLKVPQTRLIAKKYFNLPFSDLKSLIRSKIHEERQVLLMIMVLKFKKAAEEEKRLMHDFYLANTKYINNWDLIDGSAEYIIGSYLADKDKNMLYKMARSDSVWEKRIAMLSTFYYIKRDQFADALKIAEILLHDRHDLIQKAVGWMLREIGNRNQKAEEEFLQKNYKSMPRTALRYAIEKFTDKKRKFYLAKQNKPH